MELIKNIEDARILAKHKAQLDKEDQIIFIKEIRGKIGYVFTRTADKKRGVEVVKYTSENKRTDVLSDNGNGKPKPSKKGKDKEVEVPQSDGDMEQPS